MRVREPIQVYLSKEERAALDRAASEQGISRSEALRRALRSASSQGRSGPLADLAAAGYVTPATSPVGTPPPRKPVAPMDQLSSELDADRADR